MQRHHFYLPAGGFLGGLLASTHGWLVFVAGLTAGMLIMLAGLAAAKLVRFGGRAASAAVTLAESKASTAERKARGREGDDDLETERIVGEIQGRRAAIRQLARDETRRSELRAARGGIDPELTEIPL